MYTTVDNLCERISREELYRLALGDGVDFTAGIQQNKQAREAIERAIGDAGSLIRAHLGTEILQKPDEREALALRQCTEAYTLYLLHKRSRPDNDNPWDDSRNAASVFLTDVWQGDARLADGMPQ